MITTTLEYLEDDETQYTPEELESDFVNAKYKRALDESDAGNFAIEALPQRCFTEDEVQHVYDIEPNIKSIKGPEFPKSVRKAQLPHLGEMRFALPYLDQLQERVHDALTISYRRRFRNLRKGNSGMITVGDKILENPFNYKSDNDGESGDTSLALLASPGCGKTSALKLVMSKYPQHIVHDLPDVGSFHQIVYVFAECPEHSNIKALLDEIAGEFDKALNNTTQFCKKAVEREKSIEGKQDRICEFINSYNVGAIIIDEIQNMNFNITSPRSFNTFLGIINKTRVSIILSGQMEAYDKISKDVQVYRRFRSKIDAQSYCYNKNVFRSLVDAFRTYSWRDDGTNLLDPRGRKLSESEIDALYKVTSGTIDLLSKCWRAVQEHGIETGEWPELSYEFLHNVLKHEKQEEERLVRERIMRDKRMPVEAFNEYKAALDLFKKVEEKQVDAEVTRFIEKTEKNAVADIVAMRDKILLGCMIYGMNNQNKWAPDTIQKIVDDVLSCKKYKGRNVDSLIEVCKEKMEAHGSDKRKRSTTKTVSTTKKDREGIPSLIEVADCVIEGREQAEQPAS